MCYGTEMNALNFGGGEGSQKSEVQGHDGITYVGTVSAQAEAYSTRRLVSSYNF